MSQPEHAEPHFDSEDVDGATVVRLRHHEIRHPEQAAELGAQLRELVRRHGRARLALDMGAVRHLGSTGFATIMNVARLVRGEGGGLALFAVQPDVAVGARIIGMGQVAAICDDQAAALRTLAG